MEEKDNGRDKTYTAQLSLLCSWSSRSACSNAWFSVSSSKFFAFVETFSSFSKSNSFADLSRSADSSLYCDRHEQIHYSHSLIAEVLTKVANE